jgi:cobalamin biosynthesis Mg chelatase CobN
MATSADKCCVQSELTDNELVVNEQLEEVDETGADDEENQEIDDVTQKLVNGYFDRKEEPDEEENFDLMEDTEDDLEDIAMSLMSEGGHVLSTPPESFDIKKILKEIKVPRPVAEISTGSAKSKNETIDSLLQDNDQVELFGSVLWSQCFQIVTKDSSNSSENMDISSRQWYEKSRMLYLLITRSSEYLRNLQLMFGTESLTQGQSAIGAELTQKVYNAFVQAAARFKQQHVPHMVPIDVRNMPSEGLAKIRHVGAWAIKKVLSNQRKYVKDNLGTVVPSTLKSVNDRLEMCCLIEDNLIADYAKLKETTSYSETLEVTEDRQYRNRGLSHIKDQVYKFIIELEVSRVRNINDTKLKELKANLVNQAITTLSDCEELQEKWMSCFSLKTIDEKKVGI